MDLPERRGTLFEQARGRAGFWGGAFRPSHPAGQIWQTVSGTGAIQEGANQKKARKLRAIRMTTHQFQDLPPFAMPAPKKPARS